MEEINIRNSFSLFGRNKDNLEDQIDNNLPNDGYNCGECNNVPSILDIDLDKNQIKFKCVKHGLREIPIKEFLVKRSKYHYFNAECECGNIQRIDYPNIYYFCYQCNKVICHNCIEVHKREKKEHIVIRNDEYFVKCNKHYGNDFITFCKKCKIYKCISCKQCEDFKENNGSDFKSYIDFIYKKNEEYKTKIDNFNNIIILNNIMIETYKKYKKYRSLYKKNFIVYYYAIFSKAQNNLSKIKDRKFELEKINSIIFNIINSKKDENNESKNLIEKSNNLRIGQEIVISKGLKDGQFMSELSTKNFENIEKLNISNNKITDISFLKNNNFKNLKELNLSNNYNIFRIDVLSEMNCSKLEILNLSNMVFQKIIVLQKAEFNQLKILNLSNNKEIKDIYNLNEKVNFPQLKELYLAGIGLKEITFLSKAKFCLLETLDLSKNEINNIKELEKVNFPELKNLNLSNNNIDNIRVLSRVNFNKLEKIDLSNNQFSSIDVLGEVKFNLVKLDLSNTSIDNINVLKEMNIDKLKFLNLKGNFIKNLEVIESLDKDFDELYID